VDLTICVASQAAPARVMQLLTELASAHPSCLKDPPPVVIFKGINAATLEFQLGVWASQSDLLKLQNDLRAHRLVKRTARRAVPT